MSEITGKNGVKIKVNVAPFKDAIRLKNAITKEASKVGFDLTKLDLNKDVDATFVNSIIKPILAIDSSDEFYNAVMKCMERCLYNGEAIREEIFEDEGAREDYYTVLIEVVKVNLVPFFKSLVSSSQHLTQKKQGDNQE